MDANKPHYAELGKQLKELRADFKQQAFAKEIGVALRTYQRYEKGDRKVPDGLFRLAKILRHDKLNAITTFHPQHLYAQTVDIRWKNQKRRRLCTIVNCSLMLI